MIASGCGFRAALWYRGNLNEATRSWRSIPPSRAIIGVEAVGAAIDLARKGRGIIGTFRNWLDPDLGTGALEPVLRDWWQQFEGPMIYFKKKSVSAPLRAFLDLVAEDRRTTE